MAMMLVLPIEAVDTCDKNQLLVLVALARRAAGNPDNECWPSHATLAKDAKLARSTVQETLPQLVAMGLLSEHPRQLPSGGTTSKLYRLHLEGLRDRRKTPARPAGTPPARPAGTPCPPTGQEGCYTEGDSSVTLLKAGESQKESQGDLIDSGGSANGAADPEPTKSQALAAFNRYQGLARRHDLPVPRYLTSQRERHMRARLRECGGADGWAEVLDQIEHSPFLLGHVEPRQGGEPFRVTLDWVLVETNLAKVLEGRYRGEEQAAEREHFLPLV